MFTDGQLFLKNVFLPRIRYSSIRHSLPLENWSACRRTSGEPFSVGLLSHVRYREVYVSVSLKPTTDCKIKNIKINTHEHPLSSADPLSSTFRKYRTNWTLPRFVDCALCGSTIRTGLFTNYDLVCLDDWLSVITVYALQHSQRWYSLVPTLVNTVMMITVSPLPPYVYSGPHSEAAVLPILLCLETRV